MSARLHSRRFRGLGRSASGLLLSFFLLGAAGPASSEELPDLRDSREALDAARQVLEELAGPGIDPPPLPAARPRQGAAIDRELESGLRSKRLEEWTDDDRARLEALLIAAREPLEALSEGPRVAVDDANELSTRGIGFLGLGRLLSLRDRLALLDGDEGAFVGGLGQRSALIADLMSQPGILGPILAAGLQRDLLVDARIAVGWPAAGEIALEGVEAELARASELPDAAAVVAREGLVLLNGFPDTLRQYSRDLDPRNEQAEAALLATLAGDFASLARGCRRVGCQGAAEEMWKDLEGRSTVADAVTANLMPNFFDGLARLEVQREVAEVGRTAAALRAKALKDGRLPESLTELSAALPAARGEIPGLRYDRTEEGGRLSLAGKGRVDRFDESRRGRWIALLAWSIPPVESP